MARPGPHGVCPADKGDPSGEDFPGAVVVPVILQQGNPSIAPPGVWQPRLHEVGHSRAPLPGCWSRVGPGRVSLCITWTYVGFYPLYLRKRGCVGAAMSTSCSFSTNSGPNFGFPQLLLYQSSSEECPQSSVLSINDLIPQRPCHTKNRGSIICTS